MIQHAVICREIGKKWKTWEYLYLDLFAGPGHLPDWPDIPGSPIIALDCMKDLPFRAIAFEENVKAATSLARKTSKITVFGKWQNNIINIIDLPQIKRCGLIYVDPNTLNPRDLSVINGLSAMADYPATEYLDILIHVSATTWKRVTRAFEKYSGHRDLIEELGKIRKNHVKVSAPDDKQQWIFILITNFDYPSFGKAIGWHDINSHRGKLIVDRISMTAEELAAKIPQGYLFRPE